MSAFDNRDKDNLEEEIRWFLEDHTIGELMAVVSYCIESKENNYLEQLGECT